MKERAVLAAALLAAVAFADVAPARAGSHPHDRQGLLLGFNLGLGVAMVEWDESDQHYETDSEWGGAGGVRIGYAFNEQFALTFEGNGWARDYDEGEITLSSALVKFTWYPSGGGFFARAGVGGGRANVKYELTNPDLSWEEEGPSFSLGLGYEWRLARTFALGTALDYTAFTIDDFGRASDVSVGYTGITVQLNWYL
jgi:opacity protein-like surface antigen